MKEIFDQIEKCNKCQTIIDFKKFPIESHGNLNSFAILVSEAPGKDSLSKKKYWVGAGGKILRDCLPFETNLENIFYLTDIVKCWPSKNGENRKPNENEIANCSLFLLKEIEKIRPKLIVSFGGTSSSFLLNREVKITKEHGKISNYNANTKIITLLHPSGIDRFMDRKVYKIQLGLLFAKIKEKNIADIEEVFNEINEADLPNTNNEKQITKQNKITQTKKGTFTLPAPGNSITESDAKKNQIRITVDFKEFFPSKSSEILIEYREKIYQVKFNYRINRSHILKLGKELAERINLRAGIRLKLTLIERNKYRIE
jgi:uracil-DNA glycosylase